MPIQLQQFSPGDTNYISKHNSNVESLVNFLNAIDSALQNVTGGGSGLANSGNIGKATYGTSGMSFVGEDSFAYTVDDPSKLMTLQEGFCWDAYFGIMHHVTTVTELTFLNKTPGTYYIRFNGNSEPYIDTISQSAIYSVVWEGDSFGAVTQLAAITPTGPDITELNFSDYSGITYLTAKARLRATEKAISHLLSVNLTPGSAAPLENEVMEAFGLVLTGTYTGNVSVSLPSRQKMYMVRNEATGAGTITLTTGTGQTLVLTAGEHAIAFCNGTDIRVLCRLPAGVIVRSFLDLSDTPETFSGHNNKMLVVNSAGDGVAFAPVPGAGASLTVTDGDAVTVSSVTSLTVTGAATVTQTAAGAVTVNVTGGGGGGAALSVGDEGVQVDAEVVSINFTGAVSVTQIAAGQIEVNVAGGGGGTGETPADFDLSFFISGKPGAGDMLFRHTFTKAVNYDGNFAGSYGTSSVAAASATSLIVRKNGVQVGTIDFAGTASSATFTTTSGAALAFVAGDAIEVLAPDPADSLLANLAISLAGMRV